MSSPIMTVAADLFALQETDLALDEALARLARIEEETGENEGLITARRWLEAAGERVHQLRSEQSDIDFDADDAREKAAQVEKKLYAGTITNPKELEDLNADLVSLKANLKAKEDALIEHLELTEAAEATLAETESIHDATEARWKETQAGLLAEKAKLEPEIERLREQRARQSGGIERAALSLYSLLRERRNGAAVAGVERGMCQGCRITLPHAIIQKARMPGAIVQCVSCERILVFN
jgi:predicted  nucleic acid-binding Zn-ribbon protein